MKKITLYGSLSFNFEGILFLFVRCLCLRNLLDKCSKVSYFWGDYHYIFHQSSSEISESSLLSDSYFITLVHHFLMAIAADIKIASPV